MKVNESHFNFLRMIRAKILHFSEINFYCSERYFDSLLFEVYSIEQSLKFILRPFISQWDLWFFRYSF